MDRKKFLSNLTGVAIGGCACTIGNRGNAVFALDSSNVKNDFDCIRAEKRLDFSNKWLTRFFDVLDEKLDPDLRKSIMMENGRVCFQKYSESLGKKNSPITFEEYCNRVKKRETAESPVKIDGGNILLTYTSSAETGNASPENFCLCPMAEGKPEGLSSTYCQCSLGYVREMYGQVLIEKVNVELLESVLMGGKRCKFKISLAKS